MIESQQAQNASVASPDFQPSTVSTNIRQPSSLKQSKGKDLFSSSVWNDALTTSKFYTFIASLRRKILGVTKASRTHGFLRVLRDANRLIRCYTQNIDGLEAREGLCTDMSRGQGCRSRFSRRSTQLPRSPARDCPGGDLDGGCEVVQLHGNLEVLKCSLCRATCKWEEQGREARILLGEAPTCPSCEALAQERRDRGKRGTRIGTLRPNIVLYGEEHPLADRVGKLSIHDLNLAPDLLLILGTSLQVHGLKLLVREFAKAVHAKGRGKGKVILVNLSKPSDSVWKDVIDYWVAMDCDEWVDSVRVYRPDLWHRQTKLDIQKQKPRSSPLKIKKTRGRQDRTEKLCQIKCSSVPSQGNVLKTKGVIGTCEPKVRRDESIRRKDRKGIITSEPSLKKVPRLEDMENNSPDDHRAKRCPDRHLSSDVTLTSSLEESPTKIHVSLRRVLNEPTQPSLNARHVVKSTQAATRPRETGTVSPYFVGKSDTGLISKEEWRQQLSSVTTKAEKQPKEANMNQQLMSPPPSGRKAPSEGRPYKRGRPEDVDVLNTPSKRFKADINIWQDEI